MRREQPASIGIVVVHAAGREAYDLGGLPALDPTNLSVSVHRSGIRCFVGRNRSHKSTCPPLLELWLVTICIDPREPSAPQSRTFRSDLGAAIARVGA